jgi:hypothetical protein
MKNSVLSLVFLFILGLCAVSPVLAQTTYTSKPNSLNNGNPWRWTDPNAWVRSNLSANPVPVNNYSGGFEQNENVVIINSNVLFDTYYNVDGDFGKLIIGHTGSLIQYPSTPNTTMGFGDQFAGDKVRLELNGVLRLFKANFYKADAILGTGAEFRTYCNLFLRNQSDFFLAAGSTVFVGGNLLVFQGNPDFNENFTVGNASVIILGCVMTRGNAPGLVKDLFGNGLIVCVFADEACGSDTDEANLVCNSYVDQFTSGTCRRPLPVELVSFSGRYVGGQVQLSWVTASEKNSATFAVEHSADGKRFVEVARVQAAGQASDRRSYSAADRTPQPGLNYYRLKQTDLDGSFTYSKVVAVQAEGSLAQQLNVYGRPGQLSVALTSAAPCKALRVLDSMGRVLYSEALGEGVSGATVRQIPLRHNPGGIYIIQAVTTDGTVSRKFVLANE